MRILLKNLLVFTLASALALKFFLIGLSYPLDLRVRGDAYEYLRIADGFDNLHSAWTYAGDRTPGLPFFEYIIHRILFTFSTPVYLVSWINAIGMAMLLIHIANAWLFSSWARTTGLIQSELARNVLFIYLATCPLLIGHITSPLSDTFSMDLVLLAVVA